MRFSRLSQQKTKREREFKGESKDSGSKRAIQEKVFETDSWIAVLQTLMPLRG